ncbi:DNA polymerase III subunit delta' [Nocardioides marmoribigeumensis]|uniref:DNA polymerase-3 subunit delta n=1 Tax=Nocardioides marmoribigeumensis TaxID=433649 RepID=A0ABU2BWL6_9ACTN|nr:DNA polymerase III subunit delta' [Nocardioides marmoribigeumensis]MDR7362841.1 DNA polymerase-3 subunit delta' [Nocardioides marmoribigeumensis]
MSVFDSLVGQAPAIQTLQAAARGHGMSHAWLVTGPPGSGRSNAALAFAAALQCEQAGCGECEACRTALAGSHPDVLVQSTERMIISVDLAREWVLRAALKPMRGRWQILVVEDADRLNEHANNALLKAIEEPHPRTVWILCAPNPSDVLPTIRSRSRTLQLTTPHLEEVTRFLVERHGVPEALAAYSARAAQGHIGRARALALDEAVRNRRREVITLPARLRGLGDCMTAAANIADLAKQDSAEQIEAFRTREFKNVEMVYGEDRKARSTVSARAAVSQLDKEVKARERRAVNDSVDRVLMDLVSVYRDLLLLQLGSTKPLVNEELRPDLTELGRRTTPESNLQRIDAIYAAREQMLEFNTPPLLALESMMVALRA